MKKTKQKISEYDKVIDALNFVDEIAENSGGGDYNEDRERRKMYELVADFIDKYAKRN